MATEFERIKRAVEMEKDKKVKGEARINSLTEEEGRILKAVSTEVNKEVTKVEEVEAITEAYKEDIEKNINEMKRILDEEGVRY